MVWALSFLVVFFVFSLVGGKGYLSVAKLILSVKK